MYALIRITDAYTEPKFRLIPDPWLHFNSGNLRLRPGFVLPASLQLTNERPEHDSPNHFTTSVPKPIVGFHVRPSGGSTSDAVPSRSVRDNKRASSLNPSMLQPIQLTKAQGSPLQPQIYDLMTSTEQDLLTMLSVTNGSAAPNHWSTVRRDPFPREERARLQAHIISTHTLSLPIMKYVSSLCFPVKGRKVFKA